MNPNKLLVTADLHCNEERYRDSEQLMISIGVTAVREECLNVILVGDVWDERHSPPIKVLLMIRDQLIKWAEMGLHVYWIRGNHEISTKSKPEQSYICFFESLHQNIFIINEPTHIYFGADICAWMVPWYPPQEIIDIYKRTAGEAFYTKGARVKLLFSHIGISEGQVSPSNKHTLNSPVRFEHLLAQYYNMVFLGDIHIFQWLGSNTFYCGCPIQLTYGDKPNQGVWVYDASLGGGTLKNVGLELSGKQPFPEYKTYQITDTAQLYTLLEPDYNYIKLRCSPDTYAAAQAKFGERRRYTIEKLAPTKSVIPKGRMEGVQENQTSIILSLLIESMGLQQYPEYHELAMWYLINTGEMK